MQEALSVTPGLASIAGRRPKAGYSGLIRTARDGTRFVECADLPAALHDIVMLVREGVAVAVQRGAGGKKVRDLLIVSAPCGVQPFPSDASYGYVSDPQRSDTDSSRG